MLKFPIRIEPCPIIEAIIEIRYILNEEMEIFLAKMHDSFSNDFPCFKKLPIMEFPESIRKKEPSLTYAPFYEYSNPNSSFALRVGPRSIIFAQTSPYSGWDTWFTQVESILNNMREHLTLFKKIERLGLRYINFFEGVNVLDNKITLNISINGDQVLEEGTSFRTEFKHSEVERTILQVSNMVPVGVQGNQKIGSVIDIDCIYKQDQTTIDFSKVLEIISQAHNKEKELFYELIDRDFLETNFTVERGE